jgi:molybdopterin-guanine dinucleotide biosynthesis protein A
MMILKAVNISGVILAGGENKRFAGINKSNLIIGGSSIISRIINTISGIFPEIIIVTNTPEEFHAFNHFKIVPDQFLKVGPLGGIHSAIKASSKESVFVFAGDMPYLDKEMILNQIERFSSCSADILIPKVNEYVEPLHAIYRNSIFGTLDDYLSHKKRSAVRDFLGKVKVNYMDLPESEQTKRAFTNVNTPDDAENAV